MRGQVPGQAPVLPALAVQARGFSAWIRNDGRHPVMCTRSVPRSRLVECDFRIAPGSRKCFIGRAPSRRRVEARNARRRAFDKAVRRKPLGFAADAGLCKLNAAHGTGASQVRVVSGGWGGTSRELGNCQGQYGGFGDVDLRKAGTGSGTRRKAAWRGEARKVFGMWIAASCGNRDQDRWGTELDLGGSQSLDDHHRSTTVRAQLAIARGMIRGCFGLSWRY